MPRLTLCNVICLIDRSDERWLRQAWRGRGLGRGGGAAGAVSIDNDRSLRPSSIMRYSVVVGRTETWPPP